MPQNLKIGYQIHLYLSVLFLYTYGVGYMNGVKKFVQITTVVPVQFTYWLRISK